MNPPPGSDLTVGDVGEHGVIEAIIAAAPSARNGDDAAVLLGAAPNSRAVVSTDMLVEGRHFHTHWSTAREVGTKSITANFADIEAMGARPVAALLAISTPDDTPLDFLRGLAEGISARAADYSAELVGGDVTGGQALVVSVTAVGSLGGNRPALTLDAARPGQKVVAHGKIGWSAAGHAFLRQYGRNGVPARFAPLIAAHCAPILTPGRGVVARATGATSMTDNSDGLIVDLTTIARRSGVGIDLDPEAIEPDELLLEAAAFLGADPWEWVLTGGEDHTLLATTGGDAPSGFRTIGLVTRSETVTVDGNIPAYNKGWVSF